MVRDVAMTAGVDAETQKRAARMFASGVTVVTATADGNVHGLTVSAFFSLSVDPPQILICIDRRASLHRILERVESFAVNILREGQRWMSEFFASPGRRPAATFPNIPSHPGVTGSPLLDDALAYFDCAITARLPGGDHTIFIGRVQDADANGDGPPLVYFNRAYRAIHDLEH